MYYSLLSCKFIVVNLFMCMALFLGYYVLLICVSIFMPMSFCFNYYSFVIFDSRQRAASCFVVLQYCFGHLGFFVVLYKFKNCSVSVKNDLGKLIALIGIAMNL